jgi:hypothetical protein
MSPDHRSDALVDAVHRELLDLGPTDGRDVGALALAHDPLLDDLAVESVVARVRSRTEGLDVLDPLLADPGIDEIMVNGGGEVWIERDGRLRSTTLMLDPSTTYASSNASSRPSASASTAPRRSSMPVCRTVLVSTASCRRCRSTVRASRSGVLAPDAHPSTRSRHPAWPDSWCGPCAVG